MTVSPAGVVGREDELALIEAFVQACSEGTGTLLLEGEPGIGKTTLWRAGIDRAREQGFRVLDARPIAAEVELSYATLADLLSGMHDEMGALPTPQRRALRIALLIEESRGAPPDQRAVGAALLGLVRRVAEHGPLLIALDDLQWLDRASAGVVQFAVRRLGDAPVRVLATTRTGSGEADLGDAERMFVGPLSFDALDRLIQERLGTRFLRPTLRQLEETSRGNPFYALEIGASLLRSGVRPEPGEPLPIPASLRELLLRRLAALTPAAQEAAFAISALAQPTMTAVRQVAGDDADSVSEGMTAGVLERDRDTLRFTHPLLAAAVYESRSPLERKAIHRRLAAIVTDPSERARHLAEIAEGPDEELAAALELAAAEVVARGAPDAGARLARRAYELTPTARRHEAHRRRLSCARYTLAAGDPEHAETLLERHLRLTAPGVERAEVELELGRARLAIQGVAAARLCWERALALNELESEDGLELRTEILIELADMHGKELETRSTASEQAVSLAERIGKPDLLSRALGVHGMKLTLLGRPPPDDYWHRALTIEKAAGAPLRYTGPTSAYGLATYVRGDLETSFECTRRLADSMYRNGDPMLPHVLCELSEFNRVTGDWDAATRYAQEAHDLVVQTGREADEPDCLLWKARIALPRGDLDDARRDAERALALTEHLAPSDKHRIGIEATAEALFAQIAWISGRYAEAHDWNTAVIDAASQLGALLEHFLGEVYAGDVECLLALGELERAGEQLGRLDELSGGSGIDTLYAIAERTHGLLLAARGDLDAAAGRLERAREAFEQLVVPWPFQLARTLLVLGGVQRRARRKRTARESLERALEIFDRLGARLWAEKARAELAQIGGRPSRPGALTAAEQQVADLVAAGHSNTEVAHVLFMSPKTVEWNLSKIYRKLHVRSRTELAARLARQTATG